MPIIPNGTKQPVVYGTNQASGIQYPPEMEDRWKTVHAEYVDKAAWVKQMLTL